MNDLLTRVKCPMGCTNSIFTERTKTIAKQNANLLLEGDNAIKIKVYTCQCCGNAFEIQESQGQNKKQVL